MYYTETERYMIFQTSTCLASRNPPSNNTHIIFSRYSFLLTILAMYDPLP